MTIVKLFLRKDLSSIIADLSLNRAQGEESVEFSLKVSENNLETEAHTLNRITLDETPNQQ